MSKKYELEDIDLAWENFMDEDVCYTYVNNEDEKSDENSIVPVASNIYISTKTKISYLSHNINLNEVYWEIPVIPYHLPIEGVVKKQMKFNSLSQDELDVINSKLCKELCVDQYIITRIVNPEGRIKFKDVRKISIGLAKKDIISYRRKKRGAFYNCFVIILRIWCIDEFREIHVKVFNTGKLEIPGIQDANTLSRVLKLVVDILQPLSSTPNDLLCHEDKTDTVLINSNFNCGYYIDRDKLYNKLRYEYGMNAAYDPCSYPGIQCEFYHNSKLIKQTGKQPSNEESKTKNITKVSFMIFRTGSVLIVGKCSETVLEDIYNNLKELLKSEYEQISCGNHSKNNSLEEPKQRKIRRKTILLES